MWTAWAALPGAPPDSFATVRLATAGAPRLEESTRRAMQERFSFCLVEGYGLSHASPVVTTAIGYGDAPVRSIGGPPPGVEGRLIHTAGLNVLSGHPRTPRE